MHAGARPAPSLPPGQRAGPASGPHSSAMSHHTAGEQAQPVGPTAQPWLCCHGAQPAGPEVTDEERWYPPVTENLFGYLKSPSNQRARPHLWCQGAGPVCQPHSLAMAPAASRTPSRAATGCTNASINTVIFHS